MTTQPSDHVSSESVEALVQRCLAARREHGMSAIAAILDDHPRHAAAVRRNLNALEKLELLDAFVAAPAEAEPETFGEFTLLQCLGSGGMGAVYLARQESLGREVALKLIRPEFLVFPGARERFRREAHAAAKLSDPAICQVYEAGEVDGTPYIAMQHVEGETLADQIKRAKTETVPSTESSRAASSSAAGRRGSASSSSVVGGTSRRELAEAVHCIEKVARALHGAHEQGLVHRDIKPGNIMVTADGEPVLLDFGLVREESPEQVTLTHTGDIVGTPAYMSPEQIAPEGKTIDRRTDIYSLGATLYECVTLSTPFRAATREDLYRQILTSEIENPARRNRRVSRDLRVVLETALARDRNRRYKTALDFAEDLRRVRTLEPIRARAAGPILRLSRWVQRNRVAATVIVLLAVGMSANTGLFLEAEAAREEIEQGLEASDLFVLTGLELEARDELSPARSATIPAMQRWLQKANGVLSRRERYLRELDALRKRALPYTEEMARSDRESHHHWDSLQLFKGARDYYDERLEALRGEVGDDPKHEGIRTVTWLLAGYEKEIPLLEEEVARRRTWVFSSPADQRRHDDLARLAAAFERFTDPDWFKGALADVRRCLQTAQTIRRTTVADHREAWRRAIDSIGDERECPLYAGLRIEPQVGLVPLGRDPDSGLWEFGHPESGEVPVRDAETGELRIGEESGLVFVLIPGGKFHLGAERASGKSREAMPNVDPQASRQEGPVHVVNLDPYFISKFETTQGQWLRLSGFNPSKYTREYIYCENLKDPGFDLRNPVETVSWAECRRVLGRCGLRLPTEAQWEFAARAGTHSVWPQGNTVESLVGKANLLDSAYCRWMGGEMPFDPSQDTKDGYGLVAPIGTYAPNDFGLHEVIGNVSEWCLDKIAYYTRPVKPRTGERIAAQSNHWGRAFRGECFETYARYARVAVRRWGCNEWRECQIGVRPARAVE